MRTAALVQNNNFAEEILQNCYFALMAINLLCKLCFCRSFIFYYKFSRWESDCRFNRHVKEDFYVTKNELFYGDLLHIKGVLWSACVKV